MIQHSCFLISATATKVLPPSLRAGKASAAKRREKQLSTQPTPPVVLTKEAPPIKDAVSVADSLCSKDSRGPCQGARNPVFCSRNHCHSTLGYNA